MGQCGEPQSTPPPRAGCHHHRSAMGRAAQWLRSVLTGKKPPPAPGAGNGNKAPAPPPPKEKRRWSFRRPAPPPAAAAVLASASAHGFLEGRASSDRHAIAVAASAAAEAAVAAAEAAAEVARLTVAGVEVAAAVKIQSFFRSYLARQALCALRGLVKLQALVRGHLVRKQAKATLRSMQALVAAQHRARMERLRMMEEGSRGGSSPSPARRPRSRHSYVSSDENVKILEVDNGDGRATPRGRSSYSGTPASTFLRTPPPPPKPELKVSPTASALTDASPRAYSGRFDEFSFTTAQSSPRAAPAPECPAFFFPNYMANTESSRAKARSQSAPKLRPEGPPERQTSRRRSSIEGRGGGGAPRCAQMLRSSSNAGGGGGGQQYPWFIKLDQLNVSLKDSECGSTSTVKTAASCCRSAAAAPADTNYFTRRYY